MVERSYDRGWGVPFQLWLWAAMALALVAALGAPATGCECEEEGIKWVVFPSVDPSVVCVGESFTITAAAADRDLPEEPPPPPWPECPRVVDPVTITGAGSQSRATPGIYNIAVTAHDEGHPRDDTDLTAVVTVVVIGGPVTTDKVHIWYLCDRAPENRTARATVQPEGTSYFWTGTGDITVSGAPESATATVTAAQRPEGCEPSQVNVLYYSGGHACVAHTTVWVLTPASLTSEVVVPTKYLTGGRPSRVWA